MQRIRHVLCKACGLVFIETERPPPRPAEETPHHACCPRCGGEDCETVNTGRWI